MACVPSIPPCNCSNGETGSDLPFPDAALLDREADCVVSEDPACGYPQGPYGQTQDDTFPNILMSNCEDEVVEMAELFQARPDNGKYNKAVVFAFGAGWCQPCQDEAEHFSEIAADLREDQVDLVHLVAEGNPQGTTAPLAWCTGWEEEHSKNAYPVYYDPEHQLMADLLPLMALTPLPYTFVLDSNAQIRFIAQGSPNAALLDAQIQMIVDNPY